MSADETYAAKLSRPFGPEAIRQKKGQGGRTMDYVSHGMVTKRLNDAAPNWSAVMVERFVQEQNGQLHCLGGVMQMTINGVTREEAGGPARLTTLADDLKNTYSDCLERCAMRFGVALDLWESAEENDEDAEGFPTAPDARTAAAKSSASTIPAAGQQATRNQNAPVRPPEARSATNPPAVAPRSLAPTDEAVEARILEGYQWLEAGREQDAIIDHIEEWWDEMTIDQQRSVEFACTEIKGKCASRDAAIEARGKVLA